VHKAYDFAELSEDQRHNVLNLLTAYNTWLKYCRTRQLNHAGLGLFLYLSML